MARWILRLAAAAAVLVAASQHSEQGDTVISHTERELLARGQIPRQLAEEKKEEAKAGEGGEKKEEKKEGGEGEGEGEEKVDETSLTVSFLLCGIVAFVVSLFYLVNYNDKNIRQCTWDLLSDTISIFCAVLWYQGIDALFKEAFQKEEKNTGLRMVFDIIHFIFWYLSVQATAIFLCQSTRFGKVSFKSACTLGSHLSGFAAKQVFDTIMQSDTFKDNLGTAFSVVILACVSLFVFSVMSYQVRNKFIYPKMREEQRDECGEEIREVENDMVALSVGFLISEVTRFAIHGKLPNEESGKADHEQWEAWLLYVFSLVYGACALVCLKVLLMSELNRHVERLLDVAKMTFIMAMAWCLLFWGQWEIFDTHLVTRENLSRVVLALILTYYGMIQIFLLDFIADRRKSKFGRRSCRLLVKGFGLALAFAWEATFDVSIETIAEGVKTFSEAGLKMILAVALCGIVAPAWSWYVLPKTMEDEEAPGGEGGEEGKEGEQKEGKEAGEGKPSAEGPREAGQAEEAAKPEAAPPPGKPQEAW